MWPGRTKSLGPYRTSERRSRSRGAERPWSEIGSRGAVIRSLGGAVLLRRPTTGPGKAVSRLPDKPFPPGVSLGVEAVPAPYELAAGAPKQPSLPPSRTRTRGYPRPATGWWPSSIRRGEAWPRNPLQAKCISRASGHSSQ